VGLIVNTGSALTQSLQWKYKAQCICFLYFSRTS